jgi:hypothetical protein
MLKVADATAVIDQRLGRARFRDIAAGNSYTTLCHHLEDRLYLSDIPEQYAGKRAPGNSWLGLEPNILSLRRR